jgi:diamine N-acetyltransferase
MTQVSIRQARPLDATVLAEIAAETFPLTCPPGTTKENIRSFIEQKLSVDSFQRYLVDPVYRVWVAEVGEECVGYAMAIHGEPVDPDISSALTVRPTMELSKIYVRQGHHGSGVSHHLMEAALIEAKDQGCRAVWLGVNQLNERANRFYEKQGFRLVGTRFFQVGDNQEADYVRELVFS